MGGEAESTSTVYAHDVDDATAPTTHTEFTNAARTTASVTRPLQTNWTTGTSVQSTDLTAIVQETVDRAGWTSGNSIGIFVQDVPAGSVTNDFGFASYDNDTTAAPELHIEYTTSTPPPSGGTVDVGVGASGDDLYAFDNGHFSSTNGSLWWGRWKNGSTMVLESIYSRFNNIAIPQGATVTDAYVTYTVDDNYTASSNMTGTVKLQDVDDATAPTTNAGFYTAPRTTATAPWTFQTSWNHDDQVDTSDLTALVQEVIDRPGWTSGNSIGVFIDDPQTGTDTADWALIQGLVDRPGWVAGNAVGIFIDDPDEMGVVG